MGKKTFSISNASKSTANVTTRKPSAPSFLNRNRMMEMVSSGKASGTASGLSNTSTPRVRAPLRSLGLHHKSGWSSLSNGYASPNASVAPSESSYYSPWGESGVSPMDQAAQNLGQQQAWTEFGVPQGGAPQAEIELDEAMLDDLGEAVVQEMLGDVEEDARLGLYEDEVEEPLEAMGSLRRMDLFGRYPREGYAPSVTSSYLPRAPFGQRYGAEDAGAERAQRDPGYPGLGPRRPASGLGPRHPVPVVVDVNPNEGSFGSAVKMGAGIALGFAAVAAGLSLLGMIGRK